MARKVRVFVQDASQHVLLNSIDNLTIFKDEEDYLKFIEILQELSIRQDIDTHAYILMPHFFEFLGTPKHENALSKYMQSLGRRYVGYFNKKYNRTGTLWEDRYKSSLVEDELYLFDIMKHIEQKASKNYRYSSVGKNLHKRLDPIISQHELYKNLGSTDAQSLEKYLEFFNSNVDTQKDNFITVSLQKQSVTGSFEFIKNLEEQVGIKLIAKSIGRPKKENEEKRKKMYKKLVVLDKAKHKTLKISPTENLNYARQTTFMPVVASEIQLIASDFPVVFTGDKKPSLVSIVSLGGDSLAINAEGKWITPYIPSHLRKYPFSLASSQDNPAQKVILIDEESPQFSKTKGKLLFKKNGELSEVLDHSLKFLTEHENQSIITANVAKLILDSGILEDREISVGEGDEKKLLVSGFKVVDREKLNALSDETLAEWVRKGIITMIDAHLKSLENIQALFDMAHQRQS